MKSDRKLLIAILILIGLIGWLLVISMRRTDKINQQIKTLQLSSPQVKVVNGTNGYTPIKGVDYCDGSNGQNGVGTQGLVGQTGATGAQGPQGTPGLSAYDIWKLAGNTGTLQDFLASLKGEKGDPASPPLIQVNPITKDLEYKNVQDIFWQVWIKKCEIMGSCDE